MERIIYIICHSKPLGSPANHHLFTIHVPDNEPMPDILVTLIPIEDQKKPRTIMPRLPCLFEVNILTELYSIPKYNELLPSIFMFSTVPILFGMMFSDMGHGLMLLSISAFLKLGPIFYMMSFMSIYCGFIYNEFFGMKIILWDHLGVIKGEWGVA
jgi:vacuolar-type H+-ATPase subunit I/STV1